MPVRVLHGPAQVGLDPRFRRSYSLLEKKRDLTRTGLPHDRAPYYWCLSNREAMAAELGPVLKLRPSKF